jgi:hypothetical protein
MLHMCVYMHSRFVENHPIRILKDGPLISGGVLSHLCDRGMRLENHFLFPVMCRE